MKQLINLIFPVFFTAVAWSQDAVDGNTLFTNERYARAEQYYHQALSKDPASGRDWAMLMRTYVLEGKGVIVSDTLAKAPATVQEDPFFSIAKGVAALSKNDSITAKNEFVKAIDATKGRNADVLQMVADVNIESPAGNPAFAIETLDRAIKKNRKNASLYTSLGKAYRKQHNGSEAYKAYMEAVEKDPKQTTAFYELGNMFLAQENAELSTEFYRKALDADPSFAPAYYELYQLTLRKDPARAKEYFLQYASHSDPSVQAQYDYTDLLYLTKNYDSAIVSAQKLVTTEGTQVQPRLYKLISYAYQEKADTAKAFDFMNAYFRNAPDSNIIGKDYETMSLLYTSMDGRQDSAMYYLEKALAMTTDQNVKKGYYQQLAGLAKEMKDYGREAYWRGQIWSSDPNASNLVLFNWGLAAYKAQQFPTADSVFEIYANKYTDGYGYYWRARSNAAMDTAMEKGLAVPFYQKLLEQIDDDTVTTQDKQWMKEAYGYLGAYEANTEKDYGEAIAWFQKLLELDPGNERVAHNIEILEKNLPAGDRSGESN